MAALIATLPLPGAPGVAHAGESDAGDSTAESPPAPAVASTAGTATMVGGTASNAALVDASAAGAARAWTPTADREIRKWCAGGAAAGFVLGGPIGCLGATGYGWWSQPKITPPDTLAPPEASAWRAAYTHEIRRRRAAAAFTGGTAIVILTGLGYGLAYAINPPKTAPTLDLPPGLRLR